MQQNRIVLITIAVLIVVLVIAGTIGSSSKKTSSVNVGTRAVIVPTADAVRTVVVPPCGTGTNIQSANVSTVVNTAGTTSIELPRATGVRVVLVPKCGAGHGGSAGTTNLPSAAFVPAPGAKLPPVGTGAGASSSQAAAPQDAQLQVTVPNGSPVKTIVVAPCEKTKVSGPAEQVLGPAKNSTTAVAPPC
jgi:hypothetical protein